jgi:hypothetical protein
MDYNVMSLRSVWKDSKGEHDTEWSLADLGISRNAAVAQMVMRAMRFNELEGTDFLEELLGGADPEKPRLIRDQDDAVYLWFCIVPDGKEPPVVTDRR